MDAQGTRGRGNRWLPAAFGLALVLASCGGSGPDPQALVESGQKIFRHDTFGDEARWIDTLRMYEVLETAVSPRTALSVGLKVDADALPPELVKALQAGEVDLDSPATTVALIKLDAVVGVKGVVESVNGVDRLRRVGITCALCHSTVDDSLTAGIGKRLDGWANLEESALALQVSQDVVKTRFLRARAMLRSHLVPGSEAQVPRLHEFDGRRCDEAVAAVLRRLRREVVIPG